MAEWQNVTLNHGNLDCKANILLKILYLIRNLEVEVMGLLT